MIYPIDDSGKMKEGNRKTETTKRYRNGEHAGHTVIRLCASLYGF